MWVESPIGTPGALVPGAPQTPRPCSAQVPAMKWYHKDHSQPPGAAGFVSMHSPTCVSFAIQSQVCLICTYFSNAGLFLLLQPSVVTLSKCCVRLTKALNF